ncbi:MAG: hydantoinase B/oxoprolinase family protein [Nocardioidaceae bacterium]
MTTRNGLDPITVEVVGQSLAGIVQEMQNSLFCTGYSTIIRESRDASCAILDPSGHVLSQFTVLPLHLGAFPACVESLLRSYGVDELCDGDAFVVNHPYHGGSPHAPDMAVISPIMVDGRLFGFSASMAHKSDIGGLVPGSSSGQAREIFHEGIMVPPVRFYRAGEAVREVDALLRANSRTPELVIGDLRGQVGATALGASRVTALCRKYGSGIVADAAERLYLMTLERMRAAIADWPDGEFEGSACLHSEGLEGGDPVWVRVVVRIEGGHATFDFSRSDDQVAGPYNIRPPLVRAVCSYVLKCLIDPELPSNQGLSLAAELVVREGSVLSPKMPAPVNTYMPIANVAVEAVLDALRPAHPRARIAECSRGVSGTLSHVIAEQRYPLVQYELPAGAVGARADKDGVSASKAHVANGAITPVEIIESEFPVEMVRFELVPDSGGAGRFRGGLSYVREYRMQGEGQFSTRGGHLRTPPRGRDGGESGASGATVVNPDTTEEHTVKTSDGNVRLHAGDVLRREMTGAGGFGDPLSRNVERVLWDVREGYVSPEAARDSYGVVVVRSGHTWVVDDDATAEIREGERP